MDWSSLLTGLLGGIVLISVALLQRAGQQNLKLKESLNKNKQKFYEETIHFLGEYLDGNLSEQDFDKIAKKVRSINQKIIYYAPSNVVRSFGDLMQHLYEGEKEDDLASGLFTIRSKKLLAELEVQIRKDLGHSSKIPFRKESWLDMLRISTTDIREYVSARNKKDRGKKTRPKLMFEDKKIT